MFVMFLWKQCNCVWYDPREDNDLNINGGWKYEGIEGQP